MTHIQSNCKWEFKCKKRKLTRLIHGGGGFIFKGSGFYTTDYRSKNYQESAKKDSPEPPKSETPEKKPAPEKKDEKGKK
jgi:predicted nucleic acid-binding Zn ribbon protein